jgi:hypothetical protein
MADTGCSEIDQVRASILAEVIRRDYLEQMVEKGRLLESAHEKDYPHNLTQAFQYLMDIESHRRE